MTSLTFSEGSPGIAAHCLSLNAAVDICNKVTHSGESVCVYIEIKSDAERRARRSFTESHPSPQLPSSAGEQVLSQGTKDLSVGDLPRSPDWAQTVPNPALAMAPRHAPPPLLISLFSGPEPDFLSLGLRICASDRSLLVLGADQDGLLNQAVQTQPLLVNSPSLEMHKLKPDSHLGCPRRY